MARKLTSGVTKAVVVAVAAMGIGLAATPAQATEINRSSGIELRATLEADGATVVWPNLPRGQEAVLVFEWTNTSADEVLVKSRRAAVGFVTSSFSFSKSGVGESGTMTCDDPDLNGSGALIQPGDTIVCRSEAFTVPLDAQTNGGFSGSDVINGRIGLWGSTSVSVGGPDPVPDPEPVIEASDGQVWRNGERVSMATVGDRLVYTFNVTNVGEEEVTLEATDSLGDGYTCDAPILAPDATTLCTSEPYVVTEADAALGVVENDSGTAIGQSADLDEATATTPLPDVTIMAAPGGEPDPEPTTDPTTVAPVPTTPTPSPSVAVVPGGAGSNDPSVSPDSTQNAGGAQTAGALAATGTSVTGVVALAAALAVLGGVAVWVSRRRSQAS